MSEKKEETLEDVEKMLKDIVAMYESEKLLMTHRSYEYWTGYLAGVQEARKIVEPKKTWVKA